jgi:hypothetical protein
MRKIPFINLDDRSRSFANIAEKAPHNIVMNFSRDIGGLCERLRNSDLFDAKGIVACPLSIDFSGDSTNKKLGDQEYDLQDSINFCNKIEFIKFLPTTSGHGLKIYPPMGVDVEDMGHLPIFAIANDRHIPITTHCSDGGFFSIKNKRVELSNPKKWKNILQKFPNLKVNFAHLGGLRSSWVRTIGELMDKYPNVYSDVSSVLSDPWKCKRYVNKLPIDRILFGSDWYMSKLDCISYSDMCYNFLEQFGIDAIEKMVCHNPRSFL